MRPDLYTDRRFKRFRLNPPVVLHCLFGWRLSEFVEVLRPEGVPEDVRVAGAHAQWEPPSIVLLLYHPSWPEVPPDQEAPWADPAFLRTEVVRLLRAPDDGRGMKQYRAPDVRPDFLKEAGPMNDAELEAIVRDVGGQG